MIRAILTIFHFLLALTVFSQTFYINQYSKSEIDKWLIDVSAAEKEEIVNLVKKSCERIQRFERYQNIIIPIDKFKVIDFNRDGLKDVVLSYFFGANLDLKVFYLNIGNGFENILETFGYFAFVSEKELFRPLDFVIHEPPCCGGALSFYRYYSPQMHDGRFYYERIITDGLLNSTKKPEDYFDEPIKFVVTNSTYKLRLSPQIDDENYFSADWDMFGNTIETYSSGDIGYAIAEKTDETGRIWWFVRMKPTKQDENSIFKRVEKISNDYYQLGWMSSGFLEIIK